MSDHCVYLQSAKGFTENEFTSFTSSDGNSISAGEPLYS